MMKSAYRCCISLGNNCAAIYHDKMGKYDVLKSAKHADLTPANNLNVVLSYE